MLPSYTICAVEESEDAGERKQMVTQQSDDTRTNIEFVSGDARLLHFVRFAAGPKAKSRAAPGSPSENDLIPRSRVMVSCTEDPGWITLCRLADGSIDQRG